MLKAVEKGIRDFGVLGREMGRTPRAIEMKLTRLGVVVMKQKTPHTTTTAIKSRDLFRDPQSPVHICNGCKWQSCSLCSRHQCSISVALLGTAPQFCGSLHSNSHSRLGPSSGDISRTRNADVRTTKNVEL